MRDFFQTTTDTVSSHLRSIVLRPRRGAVRGNGHLLQIPFGAHVAVHCTRLSDGAVADSGDRSAGPQSRDVFRFPDATIHLELLVPDRVRHGDAMSYPCSTARLTPRCRVVQLTILEGMHDKGYVHRDIKPTNVLFDEESRAVLHVIDLGMAKRRAIPSPGVLVCWRRQGTDLFPAHHQLH